MKIQRETKMFIGILLLSLSIAVVASSATNENVIKMTALASNAEGYILIDEDTLLQEMPVIYKITVHGSTTYTYMKKDYIEVEFNLSQPNKINSTMVKAIKDHAFDVWGYTLPDNKIRYQPYTPGTDT